MQKNLFSCVSAVNRILILLVISLFLSSTFVNGQVFNYKRNIAWEQVKKVTEPGQDVVPNFAGAAVFSDRFGSLPVYIESFRLFSTSDSIAGLSIDSPVYEKTGLQYIKDDNFIATEPVLKYSVTAGKKGSSLNVSILPLRKDSAGFIEKLISFKLNMNIIPGGSRIREKSVRSYSSSSVLSAGKWIKISLNSTGVYKLSQSDLVAMDAGFATADPRTIKVYGNGGGMLPENPSVSRIDDLREMPVFVSGEEDGKLDGGDYLLFYGEAPDSWKFNTTDRKFHHIKNIYSDVTCYFITFGQGNGKRIGSEPSTTQPVTDVVQKYNDYAFYEKDEINLIKSGRQWYDGSIFELTTSRDYSFNFPDIDPGTPVSLRTAVAARSTTTPATFSISVNGTNLANVNVNVVNSADNSPWASDSFSDVSFTPGGAAINVNLSFQKHGQEAIGYLNYLELNMMRMLKLSNSQINFRSVQGYGPGKVTQFNVTGNGSPVTIWDITDEGNISQVQTTVSGNIFTFALTTDTIREFVAFDGTGFKTIQSYAAIENQNLHGAGSFDYLIITHPSFMNQAENLANFHAAHDNLTTLITTPDKIYNEFSSGVQDITAIRDYVKMIYDRAPAGKEPKYLLLFGDASYDYKNRKDNNTNFVPCIESGESMSPVGSFATDDFYGMMENYDSLQIGVGRFPVRTTADAEAAVRKVKHYVSPSDSVKNDWRNMICFVADDEDGNIHLDQTETISNMIQSAHPVYNIDKIYLDAYQQLSTPGGERIPDVNTAINMRMAKGALIMNYVGHGGEKGWAHERVLEIPDIVAWKNFDKMPVFVTATCEFTRYDDPDWVSAGEWVFLNPDGGGIALFTTTRPTFSNDNANLTGHFYQHAFNKTNGVYPSMGDLIVTAKNAAGNNSSTRKFILIGDPAIKIAYPALDIVTTSINGLPSGTLPDTIRALEPMTISGEIRDDSGNPVPDFNGTIFPTVYDKASEVTTLGTDPQSNPVSFFIRKNVIYKGKVDVVNGAFTFSFIVPKDIAHQFGAGKISYYARSASTDAQGFDKEVVVGGYDNNANTDNTGPLVRLFMNDTTFVSGGMTDENPKMLALLNDESGINTVGNGIGHDLTVTLDDNTKGSQIVNDYYASDQNTYTSGNILYPFFGLSDGLHSLRLKVWDVYNNSSDAYIEFVVASSAELALDNLFNYPNPFREQTTFSFEYNKPNSEMEVTISIYTMSGQRIKQIRQNIMTNGYRVKTINWDGTSDNGYKISTGNYVYNIKVSTPDGSTVYKSSKLVVIR